MKNHKSDLCINHILPIRDALDIISGKWKIPIISALCIHKRRFKELHRDVPGITAKMLSKELKDLEVNGLVKRTVYDTTPVSVEYAVTEYGHSLNPVIFALRDWGLKHRERMLHNEEKTSAA
ncbi:winged helix-turn-helix transcriptional regulator [Adhaeribacter terreus]|uniref:Winged helix-turn-helix transcriptional regulator n=1 Tax=Adhaeribacter terreus TaxID=529703 RepID=A0ABW0E7G1_9BACT